MLLTEELVYHKVVATGYRQVYRHQSFIVLRTELDSVARVAVVGLCLSGGARACSTANHIIGEQGLDDVEIALLASEEERSGALLIHRLHVDALRYARETTQNLSDAP